MKIDNLPYIDVSLFVKNGIADGQTYVSFNDGVKDYKVQIEKIPSNLGKGFLYYFICPRTYKRCRKLYKPKGSNQYLSRTAYRKLYYRSQLLSGNARVWSQHHKHQRKADKLKAEIVKTHHRGKPTKKQIKLKRLESKATYYERKGLSGLNFLRLFN